MTKKELRKAKKEELAIDEVIYQLRKIEDAYGYELFHFVRMIRPRELVNERIIAGKFV